MPLVEVKLGEYVGKIPSNVQKFLDEADRRIDEFQARGKSHAFVPSDYVGTFRILYSLYDSPLARGMRFCEWGSGFGVVAGLAAFVGFESYGIEIEAELVRHARELAEDFDLPTEFAAGSFVPRSQEEHLAESGSFSWMTTEADRAYDDLGIDADDFDIIYAYPWPDEEIATAELFERSAGVGALFVSYHGADGVLIRRKIEGKKRVRRR